MLAVHHFCLHLTGMRLPPFNIHGDLPEGVHRASLGEVLERFGYGTRQRRLVTARLLRVYEMARHTGKLERLIIFGSYVTAKPDPNDIDIILVMRDDFTEQDYDPDAFPMFDHPRAQRELGVSLFVIRPEFIFGEAIDEFISHWQLKRDLGRRGIVEIVQEAET